MMNNPPTGGFFVHQRVRIEMKAAIFINGEFEKNDRIMVQINQSDLLVAVDGGLQHVMNSGLTPHVIIGDLDSIDLTDLKYFEHNGVDIVKFPVKKDETDLELAVEYVLNLGFKEMLVLGATGGRIDHFFGNFLFFSNPKYLNVKIIILTKNSEIFYCKSKQIIKGVSGDTVSLIPISEVVAGVKTTGLMYPLDAEDLVRWKSRGISNQMIDQTAKIEFETGELLCVHSFSSQLETN
ncbi:MAG: thiamine diphosphokinase [Anaerolineaceae bacterium]|nr:thiamine diphosphokinase [Anaerolineaceae bacterium]